MKTKEMIMALVFFSAFCCASSHASEPGRNLSDAEKSYLLDLARNTLVQYLSTGDLPEVDTTGLPDRLKQKGACFVTLN